MFFLLPGSLFEGFKVRSVPTSCSPSGYGVALHVETESFGDKNVADSKQRQRILNDMLSKD